MRPSAKFLLCLFAFHLVSLYLPVGLFNFLWASLLFCLFSFLSVGMTHVNYAQKIANNKVCGFFCVTRTIILFAFCYLFSPLLTISCDAADTTRCTFLSFSFPSACRNNSFKRCLKNANDKVLVLLSYHHHNTITLSSTCDLADATRFTFLLFSFLFVAITHLNDA